jgi:membrane protease YdiL (CAAX protease family)
MSGNEAMVIEWGFGLAVGLMAAGAAVGLLKMRRRLAEMADGMPPAPPEWPGRLGKVAPPALTPVDLAGVLMVAAIYFGFHMAMLHAPPLSDDTPALTLADIVASVATQVVIAGAVVVIVAPRCNPIRFFGLRWKNWQWAFLIGPAATFLVLAVFGAMESVGYSKWMGEHLQSEPLQRSVEVLRESRDPLLLVAMALTAVLVAPVCEEIVFRGYVYPVVKHFGGPWLAAVGSALLFASAHSHAVGLLPLFFLGLLLVAAYELTGSLWASIAVHACFNAFTVGITFVQRLYDIPFPNP